MISFGGALTVKSQYPTVVVVVVVVVVAAAGLVGGGGGGRSCSDGKSSGLWIGCCGNSLSLTLDMQIQGLDSPSLERHG